MKTDKICSKIGIKKGSIFAALKTAAKIRNGEYQKSSPKNVKKLLKDEHIQFLDEISSKQENHNLTLKERKILLIQKFPEISIKNNSSLG